MITLATKETCCGCAACANICPHQAIIMQPDKTGFLYPVIDPAICVECGLCQKACSVLNPLKQKKQISEKAYVAQHIDQEIRAQSTSGGAFTAIAEMIIQNGGVVAGASMEEGFTVRHTIATTIEELEKFRNSKYVQSEIGYIYREIKNYLRNNTPVLFSGTPCQNHGLLKYLGKEYENLITVDLVCHSVPSPLVFQKYIELVQKNVGEFDKVVFRDKSYGYNYSTMALYRKNSNEDMKCVYRKGSESDIWFRSFLPGLCDRENCYACQYQVYPRKTDITIWDCFNIGEIYREFDDNKGTTSVVAWSEKGQKLIDGNPRLKAYMVDPQIFLNKINREKDKKLTVDREKLYDDLQNMSSRAFFKKYRPTTWKIIVKSFCRVAAYRVGLYSFARKVLGK